MVMRKIIYISFGLIISLLISCRPDRPKNFKIVQPFVQRVYIEGMGRDSIALYLVSIKVKPCNKVYSMGYSYWFTDGILDSIAFVKVVDMNNKDQTKMFKGYFKYKGKEVDALWLRNVSTNDVFQVYNCADISELLEEVNAMSINLRCEYFCKQDSSIYINRLFAIPQSMTKKTLRMIMKLKTQGMECYVDERPLKLQVYEVSYSR